MLITVFRIKVFTILTMIILLAGIPAFGQFKQYANGFLFKWNASIGIAVPFGFYQNSSINNTLYRDFTHNKGSGLIYTISKPLGKMILLGVEIQDISLKGDKSTISSQPGVPATDTEYFTRFLNTHLIFQTNFFPDHFICPFLIGKVGTSKVTARLTESRPDADQLEGYRKSYNKENLDNSDKLFITFGAGITLQLHPLLSINFLGENTRMPVNFLNALPDSRDQVRFSEIKDFVNVPRMVITLTSYSDFSGIFENRAVNFNRKYKLYRFFPFYEQQRRRR
jgi:hypothetical protein